ncbi:uncharacterized protein Z520_04574 [Fonsecaea multimorphosa CBS 102226]|uniref:Uncharacterized protein n=1 Tax=Fonsecaea multimorphosa CBS 102226 TaxID=1442371 RepID=A0A0D2ISK2_9EURO|nr:uncharacterized protein Z520_04574 [Fonsecaea multimorphosa CBS 102226]KIX99936.1 hypothetical protein Z520_04574 [Fonsecaea multimorphosa CBS 102226]
MDGEDIDATPRVLRVKNPDLKDKEEDADGLTEFGAAKTSRFSVRSISASLSSIWGRRNASTSTSCSQSESSQDQNWTVAPDLNLDFDDNLPSRGCVSFSDLLPTRKSSARASRKKRLNSVKDVKVSILPQPVITSFTKVLAKAAIAVSFTESRFCLQTVLKSFQSSTNSSAALSHRRGRRVYSFASFSTNHSSRHSSKVHRDPQKRQSQRTAVPQTLPSTMASNLPNGVYTNGVPNDQDMRVVPPINDHITAPAVQAPTLQNILDFRGSLAHEARATTSSLTPAYQNEPLVNGETVPSAPPPSPVSTRYPEQTIAPPVNRDLIQPHFDAYGFRDNFSEPERSYRRNPLQHPLPRRHIQIVPLPAIAALKVETFAFNVLEAGAKSPMTTYVGFNLTAVKQNNLVTQRQTTQSQERPYILTDNNEGFLTDLQIQTYVKGPASKLFEAGIQSVQELRVKDHWNILLKLGAQENTLKSKLSSSLRSGTKASSLSLIDQFLASLKMDGKRSEPVSVEAIVKYRHAFLPEDTTLEARAVCRVGSLASASSMDAVEVGELAGAIVHALDPGVSTVKLLSVERPERQHHLELGGRQALALIYDFRHAMGHVVSESVTWDLAVLETYYRQVRALESAETQTPTPRDTLRRRVATVAKRFSPRKSGGVGPGGEGRVE